MKPSDAAAERSAEPASPASSPHPARVMDLWESLLSRENLARAVKRVEANCGAPGPDGMTTAELRPWLKANWPQVRARLDAGTYRPSPVRRVTIPKPGGGERELGVPTVLDRFLQQALSQVLSPVFEPFFSEASYGFRPGRSAHQAVNAARRAIEAGQTFVVDVDLDRFFDRVNHDALLARVARRVGDRRVLKLIRRYLDAGVMAEGVKVATVEGTPQGSPLSPLLANIMLDDLDQLLERRGHTFVRYADDLRVYVASERAAARVLDGVTVFVEQRLHLRVNRAGAVAFYISEWRGRLSDPPGPPSLRLLQGQRTGEGSARAQGEGSPEDYAASLPAAGGWRWPSAWPPSTGSSAAGARTSRWPRRRRCSPSSTSGCVGDCGRCAGRSGSGSPRGAATSSPSVSPTGRHVNGRPAGRATGGCRGPRRSSAHCPTGTGPASVWCRSAIRFVVFGSTGEPPDADPHVRWCGREVGESSSPTPYPDHHRDYRE